MFNLDINELSYYHNLYELLKKYEPVWDKYNFFTMLSNVLDVDITTQQIDMISFFDILESRKSLTIGQWIDKLIYLL
ncbi:MAG: hypothetical protein LBP59_04515, partial [Planctomycetaceae bacterium]|nr:hypothetical protein [Planctomycetaceae bacterium]